MAVNIRKYLYSSFLKSTVVVFCLTVYYVYSRLLLEMPVTVVSSLNRGSVAVCVLLATEWR